MIPLRLVLDTNVLISAALKPEGLQRTVLILAVTKPAHLYVSSAILTEYRDVLARPELQIRRGIRQEILQLIRSSARSIVPRKRLQVTIDPNDNIFLGAQMPPAQTISLPGTPAISRDFGREQKSSLPANS